MLLAVIGIITLGYTFLNNINDLEVVVEAGLALFPCFHIVWNILCHECIYQRLQVINTNACSKEIF